MNELVKQPDFLPFLKLIQSARTRVEQQINHGQIDLYWNIGAYLNERIVQDGWGKNTVQQLADWLLEKQPNIRGFSASNLWRMRQFYQTYADVEILESTPDHSRQMSHVPRTRVLPPQ
jgi:DUF1016 N-terminal domain